MYPMPASNAREKCSVLLRATVVVLLGLMPVTGLPQPVPPGTPPLLETKPTTVVPPTAVPLEPGPEFAVPTRRDRAGRVLAPVMVNDQGPFRFIFDTGANRAVLSPHVAELLQLHVSDATPLTVHGVTGTATLPAVSVRSLRAGEVILAENKLMPVLSREVLANADGILGIEGLGMARIDIDFKKDSVSITKSNGRTRAPSGFLTIPASLKLGGLLVVQGRVGRVRVQAIIDTGAERSLGNTALREALTRSRKRGSKDASRTVYGATPELYEGTAFIAPTIYLGEAELRDLEVTFGDLHVFRVWELEDKPAILIGMDLLGIVERIIIDYRRSEIHVHP